MPANDDYRQVYAKCPFFLRGDEKSRRISCEGFCRSMTLSLNFGKYRKAYREYREDYCDSFGFEECPIYKMLRDES